MRSLLMLVPLSGLAEGLRRLRDIHQALLLTSTCARELLVDDLDLMRLSNVMGLIDAQCLPLL